MPELKKFMGEYIKAFNGQPKTNELLDKYISDPELKEHIRVFESAFPKYEIDIEELIFEGNKVALCGTLRGKHLGEIMGIQPTGKDVAFSLMTIDEIENIKIINHWIAADLFALMQQLGLIKS